MSSRGCTRSQNLVKRRDVGVYDLASGPYVYVRSNDFKALLRMRTVTGLVGLVTECDNNRASDAIEIDDDYVQGLIKADESEHAARTHARTHELNARAGGQNLA